MYSTIQSDKEMACHNTTGNRRNIRLFLSFFLYVYVYVYLYTLQGVRKDGSVYCSAVLATARATVVFGQKSISRLLVRASNILIIPGQTCNAPSNQNIYCIYILNGLEFFNHLF